MSDFDVINRELAQYAPDLANRPQVVVLNKADALEPEQIEAIKADFAKRDVEVMVMSAATNQGTREVLERLWSHLLNNRRT